MPGVESTGAGNSLPVVGGPRGGTGFHRLGTPVPASPSDFPSATIRVVTSGYFKTLRIPVLARTRVRLDRRGSRDRTGFVVNDAFVRQYLRDVDPLSTSISVQDATQRIHTGRSSEWSETCPEGSIRGEVRPTVFYSQQQMPQAGMSMLIRAPQAAAFARRAVEVLHQIDPNLGCHRR